MCAKVRRVEKTKITFYLPKAEDDTFRAILEREGGTLSGVLRKLIREYNHRASDSSTVGALPTTERTP